MQTEMIMNEEKDKLVKGKLEDIYLTVSWREIAHRYFGKTAAWLYQKFRGIDSNGNEGGFSKNEKEQLRGALYDLATRIRTCAETI